METYYRVQADIDLDAIRTNIQTMHRCIPEGKKLLAVIKANAYGHGAIEVANALDDLADYFGVGYADGYKRALSNQGRMLIHGTYAPIVGRVCMDQTMVDVSHIENVEVGDEVVLFGTQGNHTIPVEELAAMSASFNYEFVCDINRRVPRIFYQNGEKTGEKNYLF